MFPMGSVFVTPYKTIKWKDVPAKWREPMSAVRIKRNGQFDRRFKRYDEAVKAKRDLTLWLQREWEQGHLTDAKK